MKNWNILSKFSPEKGDLITQLLQNRGFNDIEDFINPSTLNDYIKAFPNDFKKSILYARDLIDSAISSETPIIIYGDYDADGISAIAILYNTIRRELGYKNTYYFVPNRFDYGYGLSMDAIDHITQDILNGSSENSLWITVDTGITALDEITHLKDIGANVIVTDHHQKPDVLPPADVIVWNDDLVGASISWLLSRALGSKSLAGLSYAALATVTDLQPLQGFNRVLVKKGLEIMNSSPPISIKSLIEVSGKGREEITTYDLGWIIGPRINASGRIGDPSNAVKLLLSEQEEESFELAQALQDKNSERQDKTYEMYSIANDFDTSNPPNIIFSLREDYHEGIIGLVAARLTQTYYRPAVVMSIDGDFAKGSVRSIPGVNIIDVLRNFEHMFVNLGGHPMAAGFTVHKDNIDSMKDEVLKFISDSYSPDIFEPSIDIDMEIPSSIINMESIEMLESMQPFGVGNEEPVFLTRNLGIADLSWVGKNSQHLSLKLFDGKDLFKSIFFNLDKNHINPELGDKIDILYTLKRNVYKGNTYVNLFLKDIRYADNVDTK